jgi:hypothetical protein
MIRIDSTYADRSLYIDIDADEEAESVDIADDNDRLAEYDVMPLPMPETFLENTVLEELPHIIYISIYYFL